MKNLEIKHELFGLNFKLGNRFFLCQASGYNDFANIAEVVKVYKKNKRSRFLCQDNFVVNIRLDLYNKKIESQNEMDLWLNGRNIGKRELTKEEITQINEELNEFKKKEKTK
jgi:hypothetical protein